MSHLRVGGFNCQGIKDKIEDPSFIKDLSKYDIFGVCETWLSSSNENFSVPNYKFYPLSRQKEKEQSRGGVGWFVKEPLKKFIKILYEISNENMFFCKLDKNHFNFNDDVYMGIIYFPPENSSREKRIKIDHFKDLLEKVSQIKSSNIILIGDFNARTRDLSDTIYDEENSDLIPDLTSSKIKYKRNNQDNIINKYGKKLVDYCIETSSYIANGRTLGDFQGKFTCYEHNGTSTVDYAVICETLYPHITKFMVSTPKYKSDHCMIELEIKLPKGIVFSYENIRIQSRPLKWDIKNIEVFKSHMKSPCTIKLINEIESCFMNKQDVMNDDILEKINFLYTYKSPKSKEKQKPKKQNKKWYDASCYELNRKMKSLAKLNQRNPGNNEIRRNLNMFKKQYKKMLKEKKRKWNDKIMSKLQNLESEDPKQYWNLINELRNTQKNNNISNSNNFEKFYENLFSKYSHSEKSKYNLISMEVEELLKSNELNKETDFTLKELNESLAKLKNNKTAGPDRIPAEMIKNSPQSVLKIILMLINRIKNTGQYPKIWSLGYTTLLHKDGDDEDPDNYRAITICSAMAKLFALMIKNRLEIKVVENKMIGDYQIGFKKGSRPADHLFILKSVIDNYIQKRKVFTCFVDYKKAYDNVWRDGLYYKLLKYGIDPSMVKIIRNMYSNTQQGLKINGSVTNPFRSYRGVRQGCVLSPLLFNLFINDIPDIFDKSCKPIFLNDTPINCLMYADDLMVLSETEEGLKSSLNKLSIYNEKKMALESKLQ